jgi:uncharacterized membrane protein YfcA
MKDESFMNLTTNTIPTKKPARNSVMELLRILCMLMIIAGHYYAHGVAYAVTPLSPETYSLRILALQLITFGADIANDLFIIITGYFMINSTMKGSRILKLFGTAPQKDGTKRYYELRNVGGGFGVMTIAGALSGILGIGSGVLKVIAMDNLMKVPFKVSTTTSNFMMGVTACASAVVYLQRGNIDPGIACPVMIGVLLGALTGARLLKRLDVRLLRKIFSIAVLLVAFNMIWQGMNGQF